MKCLNCGCKSERFLCDQCLSVDILDKIFNEIRFYKPDTCENPYLSDFVLGLTEKYEERKILPVILEYFDFEISEYYFCQYFKMCKDERFESSAIKYLQKNDIRNIRSQQVLYDLIDSYIPNNFIKPKKWCKIIADSNDFYCELYAIAAKYFAMIGEYDLADEITDKALSICNDVGNDSFLFYSLENMVIRLEKQKADTLRYRTKKPYWPVTEERRRAVAMFYDEKGISYPRIEKKPLKVSESDFSPIRECLDDELPEYCVFWCAETFSVSAVKCIYQIAAAKIRDGVVSESFESFIRPWDASSSTRKAAAKEIGVPIETIDNAEDVDLVLVKFFEFVGDDVLVSTGALGNQAKLISRAARYAGMKEIKNEFLDLLDVAADKNSNFDLSNNTREYLLSYFLIEEGKTALEKALVNKQIYDLLKVYGG